VLPRKWLPGAVVNHPHARVLGRLQAPCTLLCYGTICVCGCFLACVPALMDCTHTHQCPPTTHRHTATHTHMQPCTHTHSPYLPLITCPLPIPTPAPHAPFHPPALTDCTGTEVETAAPTSTSDRTCAASTCLATQYQSVPATNLQADCKGGCEQQAIKLM